MKSAAYLFQAVIIGAWWIGLACSQQFFDAFQFEGISATAFWAFLIPDLAIIAALSLLRVFVHRSWIEWIVLGAFAYASLYCLNASLLTASGFLPTTMMGIGLAFNLFVVHSEFFFRESTSNRFRTNMCKTGLQILVIWSVTLGLIPGLLINSFGQGNLFSPVLAQWAGWISFGSFSVLGLSSSYFMVRDGRGTPLPLDQPVRLVCSGPYRLVRNPMAVAGIGQGISLALVFQSVPILVYALVGAIVWNWVVRPIEEKDLECRFGRQFKEYRARVRCWLPRFKSPLPSQAVKVQ